MDEQEVRRLNELERRLDERRMGRGRRASDSRPIVADNIRFSMRDFVMLLSGIAFLVGGFYTFSKQIDGQNADNVLKRELLATHVQNLENNYSKIDVKLESVANHIDDLERTTSQVYQKLMDHDTHKK